MPAGDKKESWKRLKNGFENYDISVIYINPLTAEEKTYDYTKLDKIVIKDSNIFEIPFDSKYVFYGWNTVEDGSGTAYRVNDIPTWKNTGYAFELHTNDSKSLKSALDELREQLTWTMNGVEYPFFAYQQSGETFVISVYPSVENNSKEGGSEDGDAK